MKAVIIDPVPYQRRILARLLETEGHEAIEERNDLLAATPRFNEGDILFVEAAIHDEATPGLVASGALVIVTGAERIESLIARQFERGAHAFLAKPYTREGLLAALADGKLMKEAPAP
jgi:CheY-like chemotaxis protein